ncbi:DNA-binding response regulator [Labrys miyagiensis]|uniref:DNA-binding response regulator n=1 Tax=Labrys miyagiensis TaxID=346912 RepID=A0ABQ6CFD9_9HYPH|nr:response regulator transcription factor [Labrys miyagiensis]GLS18514.1 DNA-binding response regulator [Labrys miyagiensis]
MRLLLIEDSSRLRDLLTERVHGVGWRVDSVGSASEARSSAAAISYDLILLDLGLPDYDGLTLLMQLRQDGLTAPVLVITARSGIDDRVNALDKGADDLLIKPFNHLELLARCRALLRRTASHQLDVIEVGDLTFEPSSGAARIAGEVMPLSPRERSVLEVLVRHAGQVVPKEMLETKLSEVGDEISTNAVELAISRLRRRLQAFETGVALETVRGIGYLLREVTADA